MSVDSDHSASMSPTSVALLTAASTGAVAVLLIWGSGAAACIHLLCPPAQAGTLRVGGVRRVRMTHGGLTFDDGLLLRLKENVFELHPHGGVAVVRACLEALKEGGAQVVSDNIADCAAAGAWAPDDGDALARDLMEYLPLAETPFAARLLAAQRGCGLAAWARGWINRLSMDVDGEYDSRGDHAAIALWDMQNAAQWLLDRSATLLQLLYPPRVAVIGPPNAGKSTLANALLGRPASIASDLPGTTRDWVSSRAMLAVGEARLGITLIDTAGVRATDDPIEREAIDRTHGQLRVADAIILVLDSSQTIEVDTWRWIAEVREAAIWTPTVVVWNKIDLAPVAQSAEATRMLCAPNARVGAGTGAGLDDLSETLLGALGLRDVHANEPFAFSPRQRSHLENLATCAAAADAIASLRSLLESPRVERSPW